ncbi:MAG: hypothetical protein U0521_19965 [Anaerolineae bacterium]
MRIIANALIILFIAALVGYALVGDRDQFRRDDYCLGVDAYHFGVLGNTTRYYTIWIGRYTGIAVLSGIYLTIGEEAAEIVPSFILLGLVIALHTLLRRIVRYPLLMSLAFTCAFVYSSPNIWEVIYWTPGDILYVGPVILFLPFFRFLLHSHSPDSTSRIR